MMNVIGAFSEEQVERLTGITRSQLRYWDRTKFFAPSLACEDRSQPYSRIYSFSDIVALRIIAVLRNQFDVPLQHLRDVARQLERLDDKKWTGTTLFVLNKRVSIVERDTAQYHEVVTGQYLMTEPIEVFVNQTRADIKEMYRRDPATIGKVTRNRRINHNLPVIAGTRVPVRAIRDLAASGFALEEILQEYPSITAADVQAVLPPDKFAA
jgi:uncharacterized protein (DUF433 family)